MIISDAKFIAYDRYFDYIPIISTFSNSILLFQKCLNHCFSDETIGKNRYFQLANDKPILRCVTVLFPFIGNITIAIYDFIAHRLEIKNGLKDNEKIIHTTDECVLNSDSQKASEGEIETPKEMNLVNEALRDKEEIPPIIDQAQKENDNQIVIKEELENHKKTAQNGVVSSMLFLVHFYRKEKMYKDEFEWLKKAADSGHVESNREVAAMYEKGKGIKKNLVESFNYFQKGALLGDSEAMLQLAIMYFYNNKFKNNGEAIRWYSKAAECNNTVAKEWLAKLKELETFKARAEQNDSEAMYQLALIYEDVMFEDDDECWNWMEKAGELNHIEALKFLAINDDTEAMHKLAQFYAKGLNGVEKDPEEAFRLYLQGGNLNDEKCILKVAYCYKKGLGVGLDVEKAFTWYLRGADFGIDTCILKVANCCKKGHGVTIDHKEAFRWYLKGAKLNDETCILNVAYYYKKGGGATIDLVKAFNWYLKGAQLGYKECMLKVSLCYKKGTGVQIDEESAKYWRGKAK